MPIVFAEQDWTRLFSTNTPRWVRRYGKRWSGPCSPTAGAEHCLSVPPPDITHSTICLWPLDPKTAGGAFIFPLTSGYVSREELEVIRCETDARLFRQEYEASFETLQNRVYYAFCRESNVTDVAMIPGAPLLIGMDFNINPMSAVIAQKAGDQCHVIDEIVLPNSNTQEMMQEINRRYPSRHGFVHPDPSGSARKTSAPVGQNDFALIREAGWRIDAPQFGPVVDRITNVNARLCNANGQRRLLIDRKCQQLIRGLDTLTYKKGTKIPDKFGGQDHITDALGYLIVAAFPMGRSVLTVQESPFW